MHNADGRMALGIRATRARLMFTKPLCGVYGDAGIEAAALIEEDVNKPVSHGIIIYACLFIFRYEKIGT